MKTMFLAGAALTASLLAAGCNNAGTANKAAPANATAPAAPAAPAGGNSAGGNAAGGESTGASAQQNFTFVNQSGQTINTLQVSATGENSWGEDILGRDTLANGESAQISFERGDDRCLWDIRATAEGGELDMRNIDLCTTTTVTATPAG